ncbi:MAG: DUF6328 family protein [Actinomycetota bacterium]|nr:DUF6328 family protein [Actinomycetota bacterium]
MSIEPPPTGDKPVDERPAHRNESVDERMDRNWVELLQELRVTQTGVQILAGFLLTLPFQQRFSILSSLERGEYAASVLCAVAATILLVAPVSSHRLLFRRHEKAVLVTMANRFAKGGLAALAATIVLVLLMVFSVLINPLAGVLVAGTVTVIFVLLWVVLPLHIGRTQAALAQEKRSQNGPQQI